MRGAEHARRSSERVQTSGMMAELTISYTVTIKTNSFCTDSESVSSVNTLCRVERCKRLDASSMKYNLFTLLAFSVCARLSVRSSQHVYVQSARRKDGEAAENRFAERYLADTLRLGPIIRQNNNFCFVSGNHLRRSGQESGDVSRSAYPRSNVQVSVRAIHLIVHVV